MAATSPPPSLRGQGLPPVSTGVSGCCLRLTGHVFKATTVAWSSLNTKHTARGQPAAPHPRRFCSGGACGVTALGSTEPKTGFFPAFPYNSGPKERGGENHNGRVKYPVELLLLRVYVLGLSLQAPNCSTDKLQTSPPGAAPKRTGAEPAGCGGHILVSGRKPQHSEALEQETRDELQCAAWALPGSGGSGCCPGPASLQVPQVLWGPHRWRDPASGVSKWELWVGETSRPSRGSQQLGPQCARAIGDTDAVKGGGGQVPGVCRVTPEIPSWSRPPNLRGEGHSGTWTGWEGVPCGVAPTSRDCGAH